MVRVAAGLDTSFAITSSGQLYAFGENRYGQLGDQTNSGAFEAANPTPAISDLPVGTTIGGVAGGPLAEHTLAVVSDLEVTNNSLPAGALGVPYGATAQASGGTAPYAWTATGLPAGLGIDPATGQIAGTPTAASTSPVTLSVTDAVGTTASATLPPTIPPGAAATSSPAVVRHCRVPKLEGKKLKAARKIVAKADCRLKVTKKGTAGAKIVRQRPKAGTARPPGSTIAVVIGTGRLPGSAGRQEARRRDRGRGHAGAAE